MGGSAGPRRPRLEPWYRIAACDEGVTVRFGESALLFEGAAAQSLLPELLPLLDGTRSVAALAERLGPPILPAIERVLDLLAERGLLADGPAEPAAGGRGRTLELLAATAPARRGFAAAAVTVLGDGPLAALVARLLHESGVEAVGRSREGELVVVAPGPDETSLLEDWNAEALARGTPWLPVVPFDGTVAGVGPLVVPGETACHTCYRLRRTVDGLAPGERALRAHHLSSPATDAVLAGLAAAAAVRWLATGDTSAVGTLLAVELEPHVAVTRHPVYRVPRCPSCSPLAGRATLAPWAPEEAVAA